MKSRMKTLSLIILCSYAVSVFCPGGAAAAARMGPEPPAAVTPLPVPAPPASDGKSSLNMRTAHRWLGYSAIALGAVAAFSSSSEDLHCGAAWGAAALGTAALASGIVKYHRVFDLSDGISRRDGHAILGGLAAAGFIAACVMAGSGEDDEGGGGDDDVNLAHAAIGAGALAAMAVSVVVVKVKW